MWRHVSENFTFHLKSVETLSYNFLLPVSAFSIFSELCELRTHFWMENKSKTREYDLLFTVIHNQQHNAITLKIFLFRLSFPPHLWVSPLSIIHNPCWTENTSQSAILLLVMIHKLQFQINNFLCLLFLSILPCHSVHPSSRLPASPYVSIILFKERKLFWIGSHIL